MKAWLTEQLAPVSGRSELAQAIRYALNHWDGLIVDPLRGSTLGDGRLELDTNTVERAIRPVAVGRKNALFAGADSGARHSAGLVTDVLERIVSGRIRRHELDSLLLWY